MVTSTALPAALLALIKSPSFISSVVGLLGSLSSSLFNRHTVEDTNETNTKNVENTNQAQMDLSAYQADRNEETQLKLAQYQNDYNSPTNQVQRLKEAGLNPALMYKGGSIMPAAQMNGNTYQAPSLQAPQVTPAMSTLPQVLPSVLNSIIEIGKQQQKNKELELQEESTKADVALKEANMFNIKAKTWFQNFENTHAYERYSHELEGYQQDIAMKQAKLVSLRLDDAIKESRFNFEKERFEWEKGFKEREQAEKIREYNESALESTRQFEKTYKQRNIYQANQLGMQYGDYNMRRDKYYSFDKPYNQNRLYQKNLGIDLGNNPLGILKGFLYYLNFKH